MLLFEQTKLPRLQTLEAKKVGFHMLFSRSHNFSKVLPPGSPGSLLFTVTMLLSYTAIGVPHHSSPDLKANLADEEQVFINQVCPKYMK